MRIATWNLERTHSAKLGWTAISDQLRAVDADLWILTETNSGLPLASAYTGWHSSLIAEYHAAGECRTSIWTRLPVLQQILPYDRETAVCLEVETTLGPMLVYGTVIPYADAGVPKPYRSNGTWSTAKKWELHYASINQHNDDLMKLQHSFPDHSIAFGGDLNQSRDGTNWYGTTKGRELLSKCLENTKLKCVTEEAYRAMGQLTTRSTVDHICLSKKLSRYRTTVHAWDAPVLDGKPVSDHNGITVTIE